MGTDDGQSPTKHSFAGASPGDQRHTSLLIDILRRLRDLGNTVVVIQHDLALISAGRRTLSLMT